MSEELPIVIIGAGFAGIGMAIQLRKAGIESFTIFERAGEIGGTWRDNTYPGCACDVPSHVYSFSFEPNPEWSRAFSPSHEIQAYLLRLVDKWKLREHLRLNTEIVEARFDEDAGVWTLTTGTGESIRARVVVVGVGGLVDPALPAIPDIDRFEGELFHTARWNHESRLEGKRVAVIGTGASAVQVVPSIAPAVAKLSVFQRTAAWVMPKRDRRISSGAQLRFKRSPWLLRWLRWLLYWLSELVGPLIFLDAPRLSRLPQAVSRRFLRRSVSNPALRKKLIPNFQFGCKRILLSDDYWATFNRDNVELVTDPIERFEARAIRTRDGVEHPLDVVVLATGFDVGLTKAPFRVTGRNGKSLNEVWSRGAQAYKGMTVSGFPNWFILMGPNTGPGHTSVLMYTEAQIQYALQAIEALRARRLKYLDVREDVLAAYNAGLQRRMKHMVWSRCHSWYLSEDGQNHALYPGFAWEYRLRARKLRLSEYDVAALS